MTDSAEKWALITYRARIDPKPVETWPSVRLARIRAAQRTLDLEPRIHGELLAEMAAILAKEQKW